MRRAARSLASLTAVCALGTAAAAAFGAPPQVSPPAHGATAALPCLLPGAAEPLDRLWRPNVRAAIAYGRRRDGDITFAVRSAGAFYGYRADHREWSASILKAMLLVAYLDRRSVATRALSAYERSLLRAMITRSDNGAADQIDEIVGARGLRALAARVGMQRFAPVEPVWGESLITARDQTRFFLHIDSHITPSHRAYAMKLLAGIVPSQRWGVGAVAPRRWQLYFKGGWGSGTGLIDSQVAMLRRGCARVSIAVLSMHDPSHAYGKQTLEGMFRILLRGLP
jgi:Beta-lactamase enzyme family